ncbi:MAG TPA: sugar ABC transporter ATP-binding protein [Rectinemataceae bacterium]|nr:sugar ABC transporter ATP-binding protein [Rectinemataceae bacterium]
MGREERVELRCKGIGKRFPGVIALDGIDFECVGGEIHGLVGENGAGKSTLMKIVSGAYQKDEGSVVLCGKEVNFSNTREALREKIITLYQESNVFEEQNVIENIFTNHEMRLKRSPLTDLRRMERATRELLERYELEIDPFQKVRLLSMDEKKMLEVLRALTQGSKFLILDEPTSSLTVAQSAKLLNFLRELKNQNIGIILITHNISEALQVCDRITVLRDGKVIGTLNAGQTSKEEVIRLMIGSNLSKAVRSGERTFGGTPALEVRHLEVRNALRGVDLRLYPGQILGITGLVGSGGTRLANALFGMERKASGEIYIEGTRVSIGSPRKAIERGVAYLTSDRKGEGLFLTMPIYENVTIVAIRKMLNRLGLVSRRRQHAASKGHVDSLHIKTPSIATTVEQLSGGNQQKVVVAKWLETNARIIILEDPTLGIDVGAKTEILRLIHALAQAGKGVLLLSTEIDELSQLCDTVLILYKGRIVREFQRGHDLTEEAILSAATRAYS